jgi:tRNA(adenine34) deaminase
LERLVFGVEDPKLGACGSMFSVADDPRTNHQVQVVSGVRAAECKEVLQEFFRRQRRLGKK